MASSNSQRAQNAFGCMKCAHSGVELFGDGPAVQGRLCSCCSSVTWDQSKELEKICNTISFANIPSKFVDATINSDIPDKLKKWHDDTESNTAQKKRSVFLTGTIGVGKTFGAIACLLDTLRKGKSGLYLSSTEVFRFFKNEISSYGTKDKQDSAIVRSLLSEIKHADLVVLDEIGIQQPSEFTMAKYDEVIDLRYLTGKPTIYISNFGLARPNKKVQKESLRGRIGDRAISRLKEALSLEIAGSDRRVSLGKEGRDDEYDNSVTFRLQQENENTATMMHWLSRNPVFEIVSKRQRSQLSKSIGGNVVDLDRPEPKVVTDNWNRGDQIMIRGPVCDVDDGIIYLAAMKLLHRQHCSSRGGLTLTTTLSEISKEIGLSTKGSSSKQKVKQALRRLGNIRIEFQDKEGNTWIGGLFESVAYEGRTRGAKVVLQFNESMINFYRDGAYSEIDIAPLSGLRAFSKSMQLFLGSHRDSYKKIGLERWKTILGKEEESQKEFTRLFRRALKEQIGANLLAQDSRIDSHGLVHTYHVRT